MVTPRTLARHRLVGLDTMVFIYAFERHPEFGGTCEAVLRSVEAGETEAVISTLVLGELLVRPFRESRPDVVKRYLDTLARLPHLEQVPAAGEVCQIAAELRARSSGLRLPDAVHIATAVFKRATALITNDARLEGISGLTILWPS